MNYTEAFGNFAKALQNGFGPDEVGAAQDQAPRKIDVPSESLSVSDNLRVGTIACITSANVLDKKEHFPVITYTQAQSSMTRVMQLVEVPSWYNGTLAGLRQEVYNGILKMHPNVDLNVRVPAETAIALSDGNSSSTVTKKSVKNPADVAPTEVPGVKRPRLTSAEISTALQNESVRQAIAGHLMEDINRQIDHMEKAKKLAERLLASGLSSEEFNDLSTYIQGDVLHELMSRGVTASTQATEARRRELLDRMKGE